MKRYLWLILLCLWPSICHAGPELAAAASKLANTISLTNPASPMTVGTTADEDITCSTASGASCSLDTNDHGICTVVAGPKLHAVGAGTCTVTANNAANGKYLTSTPVTSGNVTISSGVSYADCSQINGNGHTNSFAWFGDHASGTTYGCKDASTSINAFVSDGARNNTTPTSTYSQGVNQKFTAGGDLAWTITAGDLASVTEGFIQMDVRQVTQTGVTTVFQFPSDGNNKIYLRVGAAGVVIGDIFSGGNYIEKTSTAQISATAWTTIYMRYKNTGAGSRCDVKVGANAWETGTGTLAAWVGTPTYISTNNGSYFSDTIYIDNIFISKTSGL